MEKKLRIAIIDDEKHALETLVYDLEENFNKYTEVIFTTNHPVEGLKLLKIHKPDLLFLDIDMPGISGLDMAELIDDHNISIVFTTAHLEYAVKAVGTNATGYLVKPVSPDQLENIILKCRQNIASRFSNLTVSDKIPVPDNDGVELVTFREIIYCKSDGNYTMIRLKNERLVMTSKTLRYFEEMLKGKDFLRVHKSFLINLNCIKKYIKGDGGELIMCNDEKIPVSRNSRSELLSIIQANL